MKAKKTVSGAGSTSPASSGSPDYAYKTIEEYEEIVGYKVGEAFRIGWAMARTTNAHLGMLANADGHGRAVARTVDPLVGHSGGAE